MQIDLPDVTLDHPDISISNITSHSSNLIFHNNKLKLLRSGPAFYKIDDTTYNFKIKPSMKWTEIDDDLDYIISSPRAFSLRSTIIDKKYNKARVGTSDGIFTIRADDHNNIERTLADFSITIADITFSNFRLSQSTDPDRIEVILLRITPIHSLTSFTEYARDRIRVFTPSPVAYLHFQCFLNDGTEIFQKLLFNTTHHNKYYNITHNIGGNFIPGDNILYSGFTTISEFIHSTCTASACSTARFDTITAKSLNPISTSYTREPAGRILYSNSSGVAEWVDAHKLQKYDTTYFPPGGRIGRNTQITTPIDITSPTTPIITTTPIHHGPTKFYLTTISTTEELITIVKSHTPILKETHIGTPYGKNMFYHHCEILLENSPDTPLSLFINTPGRHKILHASIDVYEPGCK
jgi:hypothetical protein